LKHKFEEKEEPFTRCRVRKDGYTVTSLNWHTAIFSCLMIESMSRILKTRLSGFRFQTSKRIS
jgi:hypothetical protein